MALRWHTARVTISIEDLERAATWSWRAPEEETLGGWLLRAAGGFTGRANSALAAGDPGMPLAEAVEAVRGWYAARGLPPMIAVPYPAGRPRGGALDRQLARLGWTIRPGAATVMTAVTASVARHAVGQRVTVALDGEPDAEWLHLYHDRGQGRPPVAIRLLTSAPWQAFASVRAGGKTLAIGRVAGGDWAGLTAIEVTPGSRRQGLGTAVTAALAGYAAARGSTGLYLQVADDNASARALYRGTGFADHHGYHYRVARG
jgi:N-acetylglutamate synthase